MGHKKGCGEIITAQTKAISRRITDRNPTIEEKKNCFCTSEHTRGHVYVNQIMDGGVSILSWGLRHFSSIASWKQQAAIKEKMISNASPRMQY